MKFSQSVLEKLEPKINEIKNHIIEVLKKNSEKEGNIIKITSFDEEMIYFSLITDMLKSFEKHTEPTDKLLSINSYLNNNGSLDINCLIERENIEYQYNTEAILAGGYNIQKLHYRYLTNTKLPSTKNKDNSLSAEYDLKIKKLSKIEKFNLDILNFENKIQEKTEEFEKNSKYLDEQIIEEVSKDESINRLLETTWEIIVERGADKNYKNSEDFYDNINFYKQELISNWKNKNIKWIQNDIESYKKNIQKLKLKIDKLKNI